MLYGKVQYYGRFSPGRVIGIGDGGIVGHSASGQSEESEMHGKGDVGISLCTVSGICSSRSL